MSRSDAWVFGSRLQQQEAEDFCESFFDDAPSVLEEEEEEEEEDVDVGDGEELPTPMPATETQPNPPTPSRLSLVRHYHRRRKCEGNRWVVDGGTRRMRPSHLDPGFLGSSGQLLIHQGLDNKLIELMVSQFGRYLAPGYAARRWPHQQDKIRVCIVDLSKTRMCRPRYAGWGSTTPIGAASTAKVALLYAAHQLIYDLHTLARRNSITAIGPLTTQAATHWSALATKPDVRKLAVFSASAVRPSNDLRDLVNKTIFAGHSSVSTGKANEIINAIGFDYIGSLLWQSGLRHPSVKGLWFSNSFQPGKRTWPVANNPFPEGRIGLTARSVATFYTLLAQRRLINKPNSKKMIDHLAQACVFGAPSGGTVLATKCGRVGNSLRHSSMLVKAPGDILYAVVVCTRGRAAADNVFPALTNGIHQIVLQVNAP